MKHAPCSLVHVTIQFHEPDISVGRLAARDGRIYFEYAPDFLQSGLTISPFHLPLQAGVQSFSNALFEGLPGVFNDSLPDGWGRLLLDRALRAHGFTPETLTALDRLTHVGQSGMGALCYEPDQSEKGIQDLFNLDQLMTDSQQVLAGNGTEVVEELLALTGSSAGARPKALIGVNPDKSEIVHGVRDLPETFTHWIVKFATTRDGRDSGAIEYVYAQLAKSAGVEMAKTHLFPSKTGAGFFATQRFDRRNNERLHMHTACGLLHADFRVPSLDYQDLIKATYALTKDTREVEKMFRLAVFNVLAHNRDDHSKNFAFLMDEIGDWKCAPAYDLTFSFGPQGEQSTMVMGEGKTPNTEHLVALGKVAGLKPTVINACIDQTRSALAQWKPLARAAGVQAGSIQRIQKIIDTPN